MIKRAWRWLFHRHKQPQPTVNRPTVSGISRGASASLFTDLRWRVACEQDDAIPATCATDMKPRRMDTAHITRAIDASTRPLPPPVDHDAPTAAGGWRDFYASETMGDVPVDEYETEPMKLTRPMELVEAR